MAAKGPKARGDEAAVKVCAAVFVGRRDLGGLVVLFFGLLVVWYDKDFVTTKEE